jgi:integrase
MMSKIDHYVHAATRENTRRSYQSAIEHYEVTWGGFLPATADNIARYLTDYAETLSINTLKQRLAALAQWHIDQGFPDPTKAPIVKKVLKGIRALHPTQEKQAKPLQLDQLSKVINAIDLTIHGAAKADDQNAVLRQLRNKALILVGFWRGFRSDELSRLQAEYIQTIPDEGMTIFLPRSKSDRHNNGQTYKTPSLSRLCPVSAYSDWIHAAEITDGPVFRGIDRWGRLSENTLNPSSIITLLRKIFEDAGLENPDSYSSHSLRRGFATWASNNNWDL